MYNSNENKTTTPMEVIDIHFEDSAKQNTAHTTHIKKAPIGVCALVAGCLTFSGIFGFAGGYFATQWNQSTAPTQQIYNPNMYLPTAGSTDDTSKSLIDIAASTANCVVEITTETMATDSWLQNYVSQGAGSGVIYSSDGYIVTNYHVVNGASEIMVRLKDGEEYKAKVIGMDAKTDLALLKIDASNLQAAVLGDSTALAVGEVVVAVGNPLGELGGTVTDGIISATGRNITIDGETMNLLQTNAAINPGNSGGGLFNAAGELIGIVNAKSSGSDIEGLGFAIPINQVKEVVSDLKAYGYVKGRVQVGISLVDITNAQMAMSYRVNEIGLYISAVTDNSAASVAGLQAGDRIMTCDGKEVTNYASFKTILDTKKINDTVSMKVKRDGSTITVSVKLRESVPTTVSNNS